MSTWQPWRVAHLQLEGALDALDAGPGQAGVHLVFWWRGIPLGAAALSAAELPLSALALRDIALHCIAPAVRRHLETGGGNDGCVFQPMTRPLAGLHEALDARCRRARELSASVVVCTRDRPELLDRCLASLAGMLGPKDDVVVVDNASRSAATRDVASRYPFARCVREETPGLDFARNTGIRASSGGIVAFCDDDVRAGPRWLERLKTAFLDERVMAATGSVVPASLDTEAEYLFERHWGFNRGFAPRTFGPAWFEQNRLAGAPVWEIGAGANMAFRRSVFAAVGGFDERLDAGAAGCSGDSEMWYRILAAGFPCRYEPSAICHHQHRREMEALRSQIFHYMRGHAAALLIQFERSRHGGNLRRLFLGLPAYYARRLVRHAVAPGRERNAMLASEIRGWAAGIVYYLRQARKPLPVVADPMP